MKSKSPTLKQSLRAIAVPFERKLILEAIEASGSRIAAARALGITTETLRQKLRRK